MIEDLKLGPEYEGLLYLAESIRNPPLLRSHRHAELELNLVVRGNITYIVDEQRYLFERRSLIWLFPSQDHQLIDRSPDAEYYVASFKPGMIERSCRTAPYSALRRRSLRGREVCFSLLEPESFELVRRTMDLLMEGALSADLLNREAGFGVNPQFSFRHRDPEGLNAGLAHLLLLCWRCQCHGKAFHNEVKLHPSVCQAVRLLSESEEKIDLPTLARKSGVSASFLSRIFARQMGLPLNRYRNSLLLSRFWDHYRQPVQKTLTEAVFGAGFGSYAQFYKVFHEAYGSGPRACLAEPKAGKKRGVD